MPVQSKPSTSKNSQTPKTPFYVNFWSCETDNSRQKIVIPILCTKFFDTKTSETQKGSHTKDFGTVKKIHESL